MLSLPPQVDAQIQTRFEILLKESEELLKRMVGEDDEAHRRNRESDFVFVGFSFSVAEEAFYSFRTRFLSLVTFLAKGNTHLENIAEEVKDFSSDVHSIRQIRGYLHGLNDDYKAGMLDSLSRTIEANVASDYLGQAEALLKEGQPGKYDHVPAAVLTGAILEDALRRLCQRQSPPIPVSNAKGEPKTLNPLIEDLKRAGLFNELKAKQLRAWAATRNHAAHGEFTEFNRQDVEQMLAGVQNFLADYL